LVTVETIHAKPVVKGVSMMSAKTLILTFLGLALVGSIAALADEGVKGEPLRPYVACMDPAQVRGWTRIDADELLVDAGRSRYHITLDTACADLDFATGIRFDSKVADSGGRICGDPGDNVVPLASTGHSTPCSINRIAPVTKSQYKDLLEGKSRPGGEQAGSQPLSEAMAARGL